MAYINEAMLTPNLLALSNLSSTTNLVSLANLSGTGLVTQTAAGTFAERTLTGTANQITVTNGNGVSG
ncbi:MAG: hypothetical protein V4440_03375, partial [Pseudomonadota bacterium]